MGAAVPGSEKTARNGPVSRRSVALGFLLLLCTLTLVGRWAAGRHAAQEDALHGNIEEAPAALDLALESVPKSGRLPFLLHSVHDASPGLRYASVDALGAYRIPEAAAAIEEAFQDSASIVRQRAVETLHAVDHERGFRLLLRALRDEDSWIRESAVTQLAMREQPEGRTVGRVGMAASGTKPGAGEIPRLATIADSRSIPMLIRALDDEDDVIARQAVGLLHRLTGQGRIYKSREGPAGKARTLKEWKAWWTANAARHPVSPELADLNPVRPTRSDPAPDFSLQDVSGRRLSLSAQRGRVTLLNFWGTWCPPCRLELPGLERLHRTYGTDSLDVVGAAVSESNGEAGLRSWCAEHNITYRQLLSTPELQEAYGGIHEVPVSVLIDKAGRIRYRWEGERDYATFQAAVERLIAE